MRVALYYGGIGRPGGVTRYVERLRDGLAAAGNAVALVTLRSNDLSRDGEAIRIDGVGHLAEACRAWGADVIHSAEHVAPEDAHGVPFVRSIHNHEAYCTTGTQYWTATRKPCTHVHEPVVCLASRFIRNCGSRNPAQIADELQAFAARSAAYPRVLNIVHSGFVRRRALMHGMPASTLRLARLPAPAVVAPPAATAAPRRLFVASRLTPEKGIDWVLRALARLGDAYALDVLGDGHSAAELQALAARLGLQRRARFHGWCNAARTRELMARSSAVLIPALWHEPAGWAVLEAAAAGKPVVASAVGGIPEYVRLMGNGRLVAPDDEPALCAAIEALHADTALAGRYARRGLERARLWNLHRHVAGLESIYREAIARTAS